MRKFQVIRFDPIPHHQEPTGHPLLGSMQPVTSRDLDRGQGLVLNKFKKPVPDLLGRLEQAPECTKGYAKSCPFDLDHRFCRNARGSQQLQAADNSLVPKQAYFRRVAVPGFSDR
jgi:hypothetical protein